MSRVGADPRLRAHRRESSNHHSRPARRPPSGRSVFSVNRVSWERHAVKILRISSAISTSVFFFAKASSLSKRLRA